MSPGSLCEFRTASDERAGPGNEATAYVCVCVCVCRGGGGGVVHAGLCVITCDIALCQC